MAKDVLGSGATALFDAIRRRPAAAGFPAPRSLSTILEAAIPEKQTARVVAVVTRQLQETFATAAIEAWQRGVHSLLVSASLTDASPLWASVAGYYSSHYTVRALAHALGYFVLFRQKRLAHLQFNSGRFTCTIEKINSKNDREHRVYWRLVKAQAQFKHDPLFTNNTPAQDGSCDVGHRNFANYADHVGRFDRPPVPFDKAATRERMNRISQINVTEIPKEAKFPDVASVQIVAYRRAIRFRDLLDEAVGTSNRFWSVQRDPAWARGIADFQASEPDTLMSLSRSL